MEIEFNARNHTYKVDGTETPSVTQLISVLNPDVYSGVPKRILEKASAYGNKVHEIVETAALHDLYPNLDRSYEKIALDRFKVLKSRYEIQAKGCEQHIAYVKDGLPMFAGTYDMLALVKGQLSIIDIKTTAQYHANLLPLQLGMYKLAYEQMNPNEHIEEGYCLWLPKKKLGTMLEVNLPSAEELIPKVEKAYEKYFQACEG